MKRILVIVGPTASGKTKLALNLAKQFSARGGPAFGWNGEIVSCDSRQVYQGMDIVTGKDLNQIKVSGVKVWGLDLVKPDEEFSAAHFVIQAKTIIKAIWQRGKLPILVGGTGFWLKALLEGADFLGIKPNKNLRQRLSKLDLKELQIKLQQVNPQRWQQMNASDQANPRRLTRAIEVQSAAKRRGISGLEKGVEILKLGLTTTNKFLYQRIDERIKARVKAGALLETKCLLTAGYDWDLSSLSGIGYRQLRGYFEGQFNLGQAIKAWQLAEHGYCRRQKTWFKKDQSIEWFKINQADWQKNIVKRVKTWYSDSDETKD